MLQRRKGGPFVIARQSEISIEGQDIVVVQAKAKRLGIYLMGQTLFSAQLMQRFRPRSVESVALVNKDDDVLRPLLEQYPGIRVIVCPSSTVLSRSLPPERLTSASRRRPQGGRA